MRPAVEGGFYYDMYLGGLLTSKMHVVCRVVYQSITLMCVSSLQVSSVSLTLTLRRELFITKTPFGRIWYASTVQSFNPLHLKAGGTCCSEGD